MSKKETRYLILCLLVVTAIPIQAKISLGILQGIKNNGMLILSDQNHAVECIPFGVKPLEILAKEADKKEQCQKSIDAFYTAHPHLRNYAHEHLYLYQTYHYEKIGRQCILYANGTESYSEMLLKEGIATIDEQIQNKEWNPRLLRAAARGKKAENSLYADGIADQCIPQKR